MLNLALALALALPTAADDPTPIEAPIEEVTVFPGQALVMRRVELEHAGGSFLFEGLPWGMDPQSVRARCEGAVVVGIETRDRNLPAVPGERLQDLQVQARGLERQIQEREGEVEVLGRLAKHLLALLEVEASEHKQDVREGRASSEVWAQNLEFVGSGLQANAKQRRELGWQLEELRAELEDLRLEIGRSHGRGTLAREVIVELGGGGGPATLELEYLVHGAGWSPLYDLRAASDARSVDLAYRAQVVQQTGEDWNDVELLLSTARPNLGAQGPDPRPVWLWIDDPKAEQRRELKAMTRAGAMEEGVSGPGVMDMAGAAPASLMAAVESQGLSVRFRLATRETIESRGQPTNVLVGEARFDVRPEYYATPALDTNVWLRGVATNTAEWVMLPGRASVYFGADFIGHAQLDAVQPGQEFDLHLGADPAWTLERTRTDDLTKKPGVFGSRVRHEEGWRLEFTNNGAAVASGKGAARVIVREVLPRPKDDRIEVKLGRTTPRLSEDERWTRDRKDEGILTWELEVASGATAAITYSTEISYPEGLRIRR